MSALARTTDAPPERSLRPPRWLIVVAVAVLVLSNLDDLRLLFLEGDLRQVEAWAHGAGIVALTAVVLLAPFRPSWTVVPAGLALISSIVSQRIIDGLLAAMLALFLLGATGSRRLVAGFAGIILMWLVAIQANPSVSWENLWLLVPAFLLAGGAGLLIDEFQVRHRRQMGMLAAAAQSARDYERKVLARELHDVVAHELTIITMQSSVLRFATSEERREEARTAIERTSRQALDELKRLLQVMQTDSAAIEAQTLLPADDDISSLAGRLADELHRFGHEAEVDVSVDVGLPRSMRTAGGRLLREATTNVLKHAGRGSRVLLRAGTQEGALVLDVVNTLGDGQPPRPVSSTGLGLAGLEERIHLLGGQFSAGPDDVAGEQRWAVRAVIPLTPGTRYPPITAERTGPVRHPPEGT